MRTLYITLQTRPVRTRWALQERPIHVTATKARECDRVAAVARDDVGRLEVFDAYALQTAYLSHEDGLARLVLEDELDSDEWPADEEIPALRRGEGIA